MAVHANSYCKYIQEVIYQVQILTFKGHVPAAQIS